jgi:hypothetical protein
MLRTLLVIAVFGSACALPALAAKKAAATAPAEKPAARLPEPATTAPAPVAPEKAPIAAPARITGTFSTLQSLGDGGDLVGVEVIIVGSRDGLLAIVQTADGVAAPPVIVPVALDGSEIAFPIPGTTGQAIEFKGRVTRQGLTGTLDGRPFTLPRRRSYWQ